LAGKIITASSVLTTERDSSENIHYFSAMRTDFEMMPQGVSDQFPGARGYLNTASMGLPPAAAADALRSAIENWQDGSATAPGYDRSINEARAQFAKLVNVSPDSVAIGSQVSALVGMVAAGLPRHARVVSVEDEFTSVIFPFLARGDLDVTFVPLEGLEAAIQPSTDLVAFSLAQSSDGRVADGEAIARIARQYGAMTLVDATQAAGWLPFDAGSYDVTVTGAYKWLMAPRGTSFMTVRKEAMDRVALLYPGWYAGESPWDAIYGAPLRLAKNARRFDLSPGWLAWVGTAVSLRLIDQIGVAAIHEHNVGLANEFRGRLRLSASDSAIVSLDLPPTTDVDRLAKISTAKRAGRLRVGFHLYNTVEDVDLLADALGA
jgi:selenocysteine lyase/cysteine desulfurase